MANFLDGAVAMGCIVAALFFLRFWRDSRDRLFLSFSIAFWIFAANYAMLGLVPLADEERPYIFLLRLLAFVAILWGIVDKNSGRSQRRD